MIWSQRVLLPLPGGPVTPTTRARPAALANLSEQARDARIAILDHPDRASQRPGLAGHQTFGERGFGHRLEVYRRPESACPP